MAIIIQLRTSVARWTRVARASGVMRHQSCPPYIIILLLAVIIVMLLLILILVIAILLLLMTISKPRISVGLATRAERVV